MERIINNKFLEFIKIIKNDFKNEKCFNAGGYLGSMLYFDLIVTILMYIVLIFLSLICKV